MSIITKMATVRNSEVICETNAAGIGYNAFKLTNNVHSYACVIPSTLALENRIYVGKQARKFFTELFPSCMMR
jgi:hypothetical protein